MSGQKEKAGKQGSNETLARQWEMLRLIPSNNQRMTTSELTSRLERVGFAVTLRTVQRDLVKLSTLFPLSCDEDGATPGWYWMPKASLEIPNLSIPDALSIKMMESYLTPLLPRAILDSLRTRFDQAEKRLESIDNPLTRWGDKIRTVVPGLALQAPIISSDVLETIQQALIHEHQISVRYRNRTHRPPAEWILHPLALVQRGQASYLVAVSSGFTDVRLYALHRFDFAEELADDIDIPEGFDIDDYIAQGSLNFGNGEILDLRLRVDPVLKNILQETPLSPDMVITEDGDHFLISARLPESWQLTWWIQAQGANVEVLAPESLRQEIIDSLKATLKHYKTPRE